MGGGGYCIIGVFVFYVVLDRNCIIVSDGLAFLYCIILYLRILFGVWDEP